MSSDLPFYSKPSEVDHGRSVFNTLHKKPYLVDNSRDGWVGLFVDRWEFGITTGVRFVGSRWKRKTDVGTTAHNREN